MQHVLCPQENMDSLHRSHVWIHVYSVFLLFYIFIYYIFNKYIYIYLYLHSDHQTHRSVLSIPTASQLKSKPVTSDGFSSPVDDLRSRNPDPNDPNQRHMMQWWFSMNQLIHTPEHYHQKIAPIEKKHHLPNPDFWASNVNPGAEFIDLFFLRWATCRMSQSKFLIILLARCASVFSCIYVVFFHGIVWAQYEFPRERIYALN